MSTALAPMTADDARELTDRINSTAGDLCLLLLQAHDRKAWQALGYESWREYATSELNVSQSRAYQILDHGRVTLALARAVAHDGDDNSTDVEITEAAARDIKPVLPEVVAEIRERVAAGQHPVTAAREVIETKRGEIQTKGSRRTPEPWEHEPESKPATTNGNRLAVHHTSDTGEWYTPREIIDAVNAALGAIDLDPCSNPGEPAVPAAQHFTYMDDGLVQEWRGRVYMNPPYGRGIGDWTAKLRESFEAGTVTEAIALVPARTDTVWMNDLRSYARCFVRGRISFSGHENAAPFPSCAIYFGSNVDRFAAAFAALGDTYALLDA